MIDSAVVWESDCNDVFAVVAFDRDEYDFADGLAYLMNDVGKEGVGGRLSVDEGDSIEFISIDEFATNAVVDKLVELAGEDYAENYELIVISGNKLVRKRSI